jgi:hypothetical protein
MEKHLISKSILDLIQREGQSLSVEEVQRGLAEAVPRRSLQRSLAALIDEGTLQSVGQGKGRRYALPEGSPKGTPPGPSQSPIPLSAAGVGEPTWVDVARIPFQARALAWDGTKFWTNHREQNQIVAFAPVG